MTSGGFGVSRGPKAPSTAAVDVHNNTRLLLVWIALVSPNELDKLSTGSFVRLPLEALLFVSVLLCCHERRGAWRQ